ncbi:hypothetical protein CBR_g1110 [Chara braunii]|uniref:Leucine-rich repeat-containing N-terminal plant-type domain-containing protein n=1 Tax=Chara braunii TaxID=69332 RepID=A0A388KD83_CHABU|nr:hypothetical protein CBR_g1110 [Chara braunii]|eukprot:GBG67991.1 hypothetical protein CBR_g1110 [Chara braunii]
MDASQYNVRAVLEQQEGEKLRPVEYMSKKMSSKKSLEGKGLKCEFPSNTLSKLTTIRQILLKSNQFFGTVNWTELSKLQSLTDLDLSRNNLSGSISCELASRSLEHLGLGHNKFTGEIPFCYLENPGLYSFSIEYNSLVGSLPAKLSPQLVLQQFIINDNQIGGTISPDFGNLTSLTIFSIGNNKISGTIPDTLFKESLWILNLAGNNITGSIPSTVGAAVNLEVLDISSNRIGGPLSSSVLSLAKLRELM